MSDFSANQNEFNLNQPFLHDITDKTPQTLSYASDNKGIKLAFIKWQHKQWVLMLYISVAWMRAKVLILNSSLIILSIGISKIKLFN